MILENDITNMIFGSLKRNNIWVWVFEHLGMNICKPIMLLVCDYLSISTTFYVIIWKGEYYN